jgi:hypothetical protein
MKMTTLLSRPAGSTQARSDRIEPSSAGGTSITIGLAVSSIAGRGELGGRRPHPGAAEQQADRRKADDEVRADGAVDMGTGRARRRQR